MRYFRQLAAVLSIPGKDVYKRQAYVTGDGNRGPHAWVNLLTTDETWQSYGGYGYNTCLLYTSRPDWRGPASNKGHS